MIVIVIVNYNAGTWLSRCVECVCDQTVADFRCVIVDNGSTDGSLESLPVLDERFDIVKLGKNSGFAHASNRGAYHFLPPNADFGAQDWIVMLNPDAFARPDWLEKLLEARFFAKNVTMIGSTQYMALEPDVFDGLGDFYHVSGLAWRAGFEHKVRAIETYEAFGPCGAGAMYHGQTFQRLGGYDERFFCYHEDVDLAYRMRLAGGICIQSAEAAIDHVSSAISGRASDFAVYHGTRNRFWTFMKNTPTRLLPFLMPIHLALSLFVLFWAGLRSGRFRPTARGLWQGMKGLGPIWKSRKAVKASRQISVLTLLRSFTWTIAPVRKRDIPKVNPVSKPANPMP